MSKKQTYTFQTEVSQLLHLMVHSLYSNKEIFLRELISNASDAVDKLKFEALSNEKLYEGGNNKPEIYIDIDKKAKTITIKDNGIGMTKDEVMTNIGTIANSGTRKFLESLDKTKAKASNLIGQFGVGFYSSFIVADKVTLTTRKAGDDKSNGSMWISDGKGEYSLETTNLNEYGTSVTLHLKNDSKEFLEDFTIKNVISKYSDHITVPIMMLKTDTDDKDKKAKKEKVIEYETVNKARAFWTEDKRKLKKDDYNDYYRELTYDFEPPLSYIHNKVEGAQDYISLFYIPKKAPFDLWEPKRKGGIKLYVKKVFIMEDSEHLMPMYLRFVKGIVDTNDLPLNVSREILQQNKVIDKIRQASIKRILAELEKMAANKPEQYAEFWKEFGMVIKEGVVEDFQNKDKIANLLRFASTNQDSDIQSVSFKDYVSRMAKKQEHIYYITAENYSAAKGSPHLEIFKDKNIEVLLLTDRVDEWLVNNFNEYEGKKLKSVAKGDIENLADEKTKKDKEKTQKDYQKVIKKAKEVLADSVKDIKISDRLKESPSCLVADENEMGANMERIMKSLGQQVPDFKPILELNPEHKLVKKLKDKFDNDLIYVLFDQAVLAEGGQIKNPTEFVKRVNKLID